MVAVIQVKAGASRWCEIAVATPAVAGTFLRVFPTTTFLCLHRSMPAVFAEGCRAYPWGLGGSPFWPFAGPHPGNNVATIAAYWATCAEQLLDFEASYAQACLRIRYEDLAADCFQQASELYRYLGLDTRDLAVLRQPGQARNPSVPDSSRSDPQPPASQMPPPLRRKINEMHASLGYPAIG